MKIIQLAVALNNEGEESLYALCDDGSVLQRRWASKPRAVVGRAPGTTYMDGWTEGWIPVDAGWSVAVKHPEDTRSQS
jgi:hypothetical protein